MTVPSMTADPIALAKEMPTDEIELLKRELAVEKAERIYAAKLMHRYRDTLSNVRDHIDDEGDRRYFGSTNDADQLIEIVEAVEDLNWDRIMKATKGRDLYAEMRLLRTEKKSAESQLAAAKAEIAGLRTPCLALIACFDELKEKAAAGVMGGLWPKSDEELRSQSNAAIADLRIALLSKEAQP